MLLPVILKVPDGIIGIVNVVGNGQQLAPDGVRIILPYGSDVQLKVAQLPDEVTVFGGLVLQVYVQPGGLLVMQ